MIPKPSRNRSRRLRKKLRVDEFQDFCFDFEFTANMSNFSLDKFSDDLIDLVEDNGLSLFSSSHGVRDGEKGQIKFYAHISQSSCPGCTRYGCKPGQPIVESHRELFKTFVEQQIPGVTFIKFSPLKDLNYSDED